jgi:PTS system nitrogen regulatory IIA component
MPHTIFDIDQVAEYLHVSPAAVRKLVRNHDIPFEQVGQRTMFRRSEVDAWASRRLMGWKQRELADFHATSAKRADESMGEPIRIADFLHRSALEPHLRSKTRAAVIRDMVEVSERTELLYDPDTLLQSIQAREELCSTALAGGFAVLHPRNHDPYVAETSFVALGRTLQNIPFGAPDGSTTDLFFLIYCQNDRAHLHVLSKLCLLCYQTEVLDQLRQAESADELWECVRYAEDQVAAKRR